jgi:hypothetical protein
MSNRKYCMGDKDKPCLKDECGMYNCKVKDCSLPNLAYNTFVFNNNLKVMNNLLVDYADSIERLNKSIEVLVGLNIRQGDK